MSLSIFGGDQVTILDIPIDVKTGEFHTYTAQLTKYASESGDVVSNHIILDPPSVEISAEVSNYDAEGSVQGERAKTVFASMVAAIASRQRYDLLTKHCLYTDMCLVSFTPENTGPFNGRMTFKCKFQKAPVGTLETVGVTASKLPPRDVKDVHQTAPPIVDQGRQEPVTPSNDNRSWAQKALDNFKGAK